MNYRVLKQPYYSSHLVSKMCCKFECHEGEVNAIKFHKAGKYFATGGGGIYIFLLILENYQFPEMKMFCFFLDRKIKLWEYKDGKCELLNSLIGSNAAIASIDIDNEVRYFFKIKLKII